LAAIKKELCEREARNLEAIQLNVKYSEELRALHNTRAVLLMQQKKPFIIVEETEPEFMPLFKTRRLRALRAKAWTERDEAEFTAYLKRWADADTGALK
jgi:hypothetical protein